jgi:hypothetical protein
MTASIFTFSFPSASSSYLLLLSLFPLCSFWDKLSLDGNEVNDDEDTEIEIMRPKRGLDQNEKTNQTPVNEKSGNSESKSK